jgi:hypothetical protein
MKRRILSTLLVAAALTAVGATPAFAKAPGTNYPEQPGNHVQNACAVITTNPGTNLEDGVSGAHWSPTAEAILVPLLGDACFGG